MKRIGILAGMACLGVALAACGSSADSGSQTGGATSSPTETQETSAEPIKIGALLDLTGPFASLGKEQQIALDLTIEEINAAGGVNGRPIEVQVEDAQTSVDRSVELARTFITEGVQVILGPTGASACNAVREVTERDGVVIYCYSGAPFEFSQHMFSGQFDPIEGLAGLPLNFFQSQGWTRVACIKSADASGEAYSVPLNELAPEYGIEIVAEETYQPGATDVVPQMTTIQAANPDVIYSCASGQNLVAVARAAVQLGIKAPIFAGTGSVQYAVLEAVIPYIPEGGIFSTGSALLAPGFLEGSDPRSAIIASFTEEYVSRSGGSLPSVTAGDFADSLKILTQAMAATMQGNEVGDGTAIAKAVEQIQGLDGIISNYNFAPDRHRGTALDSLIVQWTPEGFVPVDVDLS